MSEVERGRACGCFCTACNGSVIAKKGKRNAWHFAHDAAGNCATAAETALHRAIKQVIADGSVLAVPELTVEETATFDGYERSASRTLARRRVTYSAPRLEVRIEDIVADSVVTVAGRDLIVEVAVTHQVEADKASKLGKLGIAAIELLAWQLNRDVDWNMLRAFVRDSFENRIWLHNGREPVQRQLAYMDALQHAKKASAYDRRLKSRAVETSAVGVQTNLSPIHVHQWAIDKFKRLWATYGSGTLTRLDLDRKAAGYVARWSEADAAGDPSAYFDLLVEWVREHTDSIVQVA
ncbi:competence protein CoiA family protein [Paraburkholderia sacchari]|uniref:competence protein CoiA family protein n=1 Tax=Paraburkholderia sacchari TaxID=159450 RepID=UPI003B7EBA43